MKPVAPPLRNNQGERDRVIGAATPYQRRLLLGVLTNTTDAAVTRTRRLVTITPRKGEVHGLVDQQITHPTDAVTATGRTSKGSFIRKTTTKTGPSLSVWPLVNAELTLVWLKLDATVRSFAGYADPKTTNPKGDRELRQPLPRELELEGNLAVPDGNAIVLGGIQSNHKIGKSGETSVTNNLLLKRTSLFGSKKRLGKRQVLLVVTPTLIDSFGDPIRKHTASR